MQVHESGTTAVVTGRAVQDGTYKGQALTKSVAFIDTFVMQQGKWRAVGSNRSISHDVSHSQ
jgi:hypothetical protein